MDFKHFHVGHVAAIGVARVGTCQIYIVSQYTSLYNTHAIVYDIMYKYTNNVHDKQTVYTIQYTVQ